MHFLDLKKNIFIFVHRKIDRDIEYIDIQKEKQTDIQAN